jgi:hypothetical protein
MSDSDELNQKFLDFGALGYPAVKIASVLSIKVSEAEQMLASDYAKSYQTGKDRFDYAVDVKLMQLATQGDMKALERLRREFKARE